jgi:hypothetical protein
MVNSFDPKTIADKEQLDQQILKENIKLLF